MTTAPLALFDGIGMGELLLVAFISVLVFGGRLPEAMRNLGRAYARFRQGLSEMSRPLREEFQATTAYLPKVEPPPVLGAGMHPPEPVPTPAYEAEAAPGGTAPRAVAAAGDGAPTRPPAPPTGPALWPEAPPPAPARPVEDDREPPPV